MTIVISPNQIPEKSILDAFGRQTYLGNAFILSTNPSLGDTNEHNITLIKNPAGSGKGLFLFNRKVFSDSAADNIYFRYYAAPTVTNAGTATPGINLRSGAATTPVALTYLTPTTSAKGTLIATLIGTVYAFDSSVLSVIDPGTQVLVTAQAISGTPKAVSELVWYEI